MNTKRSIIDYAAKAREFNEGVTSPNTILVTKAGTSLFRIGKLFSEIQEIADMPEYREEGVMPLDTYIRI